MTRMLRRSLAIFALVVTVGLAFFAGVAYAADQRLHEADGALEKAAALLDASRTDATGKNLERFLRHRARAILRVEQARQQIEKAILASDADDQ